jgi:phosphoribosylaminoimidazole-succinocarboxamide synthase
MNTDSVETVMRTELPLKLVGRGKVRDIYEVSSDRLLVVSTDRLSAFDVVLPNPIPYKGKVLNQISVFWFRLFESWMPHHLITDDVKKMNLPAEVVERFGSQLQGRSMLVKKAKPLSIECVVRGYVAGSGWKDYQATGTICGHSFEPGMKQCQKLPRPIFTPATKESEGHDINIDFEAAAKRETREVAEKAKNFALTIYEKGSEYAAQRGIIIADTKFEFGLLGSELILIDEVMTPDSSRFWPRDSYAPGHDQPSFDKQIVRNYLLDLRWNQKPPAPELPAVVVEKTSQAYRDVYRRLTGRDLA